MQKDERDWAKSVYMTFYSWRPGWKYNPASFRGWLRWIEEIEVAIHPGGRATLSHPSEMRQVEIRWDSSKKQTEPLFATSFRVSAPAGQTLPWTEFQFSHYFASLGITLIRMSRASRARPNALPRPHRGRPAPLDFYRALVAEYDELVAVDRHKHPVAELARRYDAPPGTIKSWLSRGREYLKREEA